MLTAVAAMPGEAGAAAPAQDFRVTRVRFLPAPGHAAEVKGGQFAGSLTSATNDFERIAR
jgi:hypothetical protein